MRRQDRENNDPEFVYNVLNKAETLVISMDNDGWPYCLPVNFALSGDCIYIHCALAGTKLDCIAKNNRLAFCAAIDIEIDQQHSTTYFRSVCGRAIGSLVEDEREKGHALDLLAEKYQALCQRPAPMAAIRRVGIIRLDIVEITGKQNSHKQVK